MARGRLLRTKVRDTKAITKAQFKAERNAEYAWKNSDKGFWSSARDHVGRLIDRIDPLELAACVGITIVVHDTIVATEAFVVKATTTVISSGLLGFLLKSSGADVILNWITGGGASTGSNENQPNEGSVGGSSVNKPSSAWTNDLLLWLISFSIAYLLVHNAGALIGTLGLGIDKLVPLLLGVV